MPTARTPEFDAPPALRRCVGDADAFLRRAWGRHHHLHRGDGADAADLFGLASVDRILATMSLRTPAFRLVRGGHAIPPSAYTRRGTVGGRNLTDLIDVGRVHALFDDGATIVLQGVHRYWEPVTRFTRELELFLTHPVQANAYVTPPVASGLDVHHDTHDVFAVQTHGEKRWVIYRPVVERPLRSQRWSSRDHDPGEPVLDVTLRAGDCLYVPRGTPHAAVTVDEASVHLAIGIRAATWHDLFAAAVAQTSDDARFREALPAGYADDPTSFAPEVAAKLKELAAWLEDADAAAVARHVARTFWTSRQPVLEGQLEQLLRVDDIDDATVVERRSGTVAHVQRDGERLELVLGDRIVALPLVAEPAVRRVLTLDRFTVGDLADVLDGAGRLVLVRRLVREGLLRATWA